MYLPRTDWTKNTPYYKNLLDTLKPSIPTLEQAVDRIISEDTLVHADNWEEMLRDVVLLTRTANDEEIETAIQILSNYNWFRNWLIYLIKITDLSKRESEDKELIPKNI